MHAAEKKSEWITVAQAADRLPIPVSRSTVRRWIEEGKHGIVAGRFGGRLVVRADTLPGIVEEDGLGDPRAQGAVWRG
jgi:excisionase family DNA binding protein